MVVTGVASIYAALDIKLGIAGNVTKKALSLLGKNRPYGALDVGKPLIDCEGKETVL